MDTHYYSLHVCCSDNEGGIRVKTSGYDGEIHYTGEECISADSPDIDAWRWVHLNRKSFPPIIEQKEFAQIARVFREGPPEIRIPEDGYYFIEVEWSGPAKMASEVLFEAQTKRAFPRQLHIIDNDSAQSGECFPHLGGFLHGWGEIFGFSDGACDLYLRLGKDADYLAGGIKFLYDSA